MTRLEENRTRATRYHELIRSGVSIADAFAEVWTREGETVATGDNHAEDPE